MEPGASRKGGVYWLWDWMAERNDDEMAYIANSGWWDAEIIDALGNAGAYPDYIQSYEPSLRKAYTILRSRELAPTPKKEPEPKPVVAPKRKKIKSLRQILWPHALKEMEQSLMWLQMAGKDGEKVSELSERYNSRNPMSGVSNDWWPQWKRRRLSSAEVDEAFQKIVEKRPITVTEPCTLGIRHYHQQAFNRLIGPESAMTRVLLDMGVGTGKTRCFLDVVDKFWYDSRPIVVFMPTNGTRDNFYQAMLQFPCCVRDLRLHAALRVNMPGLLTRAEKSLGMPIGAWFNMFNTSPVPVNTWGEPGCCSVNNMWSDEVVGNLWKLCKVNGKNVIVETLAMTHNSQYSLPGIMRDGDAVKAAPRSIVEVRNSVFNSIQCGVAVKPLRVFGGGEKVSFPWRKSAILTMARSRKYPQPTGSRIKPDHSMTDMLNGCVVIFDEVHKINPKGNTFKAVHAMSPDLSVLVAGTATPNADVVDLVNGRTGRGYCLTLPDAAGIFPEMSPAKYVRVNLPAAAHAKSLKLLKRGAPFKKFKKKAGLSARPSEEDVAAALFEDLASENPSKEAEKCLRRMQELNNTSTYFTRWKRHKTTAQDAKLKAISDRIQKAPEADFPIMVMIESKHGLCALKQHLDKSLDGMGIQILDRLDVNKNCARQKVAHVQSEISRSWRSVIEAHGSRVVLLVNTLKMVEGVNMPGARLQLWANPPYSATTASQGAGRVRRGCKYHKLDGMINPIKLEVFVTTVQSPDPTSKFCMTGDEIAAHVLTIDEKRRYADRIALRSAMQAYMLSGGREKQRYFASFGDTVGCSPRGRKFEEMKSAVQAAEIEAATVSARDSSRATVIDVNVPPPPPDADWPEIPADLVARLDAEDLEAKRAMNRPMYEDVISEPSGPMAKPPAPSMMRRMYNMLPFTGGETARESGNAMRDAMLRQIRSRKHQPLLEGGSSNIRHKGMTPEGAKDFDAIVAHLKRGRLPDILGGARALLTGGGTNVDDARERARAKNGGKEPTFAEILAEMEDTDLNEEDDDGESIDLEASSDGEDDDVEFEEVSDADDSSTAGSDTESSGGTEDAGSEAAGGLDLEGMFAAILEQRQEDAEYITELMAKVQNDAGLLDLFNEEPPLEIYLSSGHIEAIQRGEAVYVAQPPYKEFELLDAEHPAIKEDIGSGLGIFMRASDENEDIGENSVVVDEEGWPWMVANDSLKQYLQYVLISDEAELSGDDSVDDSVDEPIMSEPIIMPDSDDNSDVDTEPIRFPPQSQDVKMPAQHCMYNSISERCNKANTGGIDERCYVNERGACAKLKTQKGRRVAKMVNLESLVQAAAAPPAPPAPPVPSPSPRSSSKFVLPANWSIIETVRKTGKTAGHKDKQYVAPTGKRYRSLRQVQIALGLEPVSPRSSDKRQEPICVLTPKNRCKKSFDKEDFPHPACEMNASGKCAKTAATIAKEAAAKRANTVCVMSEKKKCKKSTKPGDIMDPSCELVDGRCKKKKGVVCVVSDKGKCKKTTEFGAVMSDKCEMVDGKCKNKKGDVVCVISDKGKCKKTNELGAVMADTCELINGKCKAKTREPVCVISEKTGRCKKTTKLGSVMAEECEMNEAGKCVFKRVETPPAPECSDFSGDIDACLDAECDYDEETEECSDASFVNDAAEDLFAIMRQGMVTDELVKARREAEGISDDGDEEFTPSDEDDEDDEDEDDEDKLMAKRANAARDSEEFQKWMSYDPLEADRMWQRIQKLPSYAREELKQKMCS